MGKVIDLSGAGLQRQYKAGEASIKPGMLLEIDSAGEVVSHNVLQGTALRLFAIENELLGKGIDVVYADNDTVQTMAFPSGAEVNALASETIAVGDWLDSAADGQLKVVDASAATGATERNSVIGIAKSAATVGLRVIVELV